MSDLEELREALVSACAGWRVALDQAPSGWPQRAEHERMIGEMVALADEVRDRRMRERAGLAAGAGRQLRVGSHRASNIYWADSPAGAGGDDQQVGYIRLGWLAEAMVAAYNRQIGERVVTIRPVAFTLACGCRWEADRGQARCVEKSPTCRHHPEGGVLS